MLSQVALPLLLLLLSASHKADSQCFSTNDDLGTIQSYHNVFGMVNFSIDLTRELLWRTPPDRNLFISPYSVWNGLVIAYMGAEGKTRHEMEEVLGIRDKVVVLKTWWMLEQIYKKRQVRNSFNTFVMSNRVFVDNRVPLNPCAVNILRNQIQKIDFLEYHNATDSINAYVSEQTLGLISNIVTPREIYQAIMVMVNAAAFKGMWKHKFSPNNTSHEKFFVSPEKYVRVPMMKQEGQFRNGMSRELGARILELPYADGSFSMFVFLPNEDLSTLVSRLDPDSFHSAITNMWHHQVTVQIPRFTFHSSIKGDLKLALYKLGIRELFSESADLTTLAPRGSLVVSRTFHQAALQVTEEGTQASAATVFVSLSRTKSPPPTSFICDRPFAFVIHDNQTRNIVFMGVYRNPME